MSASAARAPFGEGGWTRGPGSAAYSRRWPSRMLLAIAAGWRGGPRVRFDRAVEHLLAPSPIRSAARPEALRCGTLGAAARGPGSDLGSLGVRARGSRPRPRVRARPRARGAARARSRRSSASRRRRGGSRGGPPRGRLDPALDVRGAPARVMSDAHALARHHCADLRAELLLRIVGGPESVPRSPGRASRGSCAPGGRCYGPARAAPSGSSGWPRGTVHARAARSRRCFMRVERPVALPRDGRGRPLSSMHLLGRSGGPSRAARRWEWVARSGSPSACSALNTVYWRTNWRLGHPLVAVDELAFVVPLGPSRARR